MLLVAEPEIQARCCRLGSPKFTVREWSKSHAYRAGLKLVFNTYYGPLKQYTFFITRYLSTEEL